MLRTEKERVVEELTERLRVTDSLIVADYRGLTNAQLADVRSRLREHGATFAVVKNTLTRRAAEAAGTDWLLELLEGPTAIAFVGAEGDPVAVAKALSDTARETKILALRGGALAGAPIGADAVDELAKLPPVDVLKGQLVGVIVAPLTQLLGLLTAPMRDLVGLIDARIAQLDEDGATAAPVGEVAETAPDAGLDDGEASEDAADGPQDAAGVTGDESEEETPAEDAPADAETLNDDQEA
jgi:large subunit ribosomal protein L10